ncbi:MAG: hypothetical protein HWN66_18090 [Candidatus Helarchaeota archaeon]|nr:hypothetical protein [Candidatus Helarchaeota archaeon]
MPICPYCEKEVHLKQMIPEVEKIRVWNPVRMFFCPHCDKILGVTESNRK